MGVTQTHRLECLRLVIIDVEFVSMLRADSVVQLRLPVYTVHHQYQQSPNPKMRRRGSRANLLPGSCGDERELAAPKHPVIDIMHVKLHCKCSSDLA
eukprot:4653046-Amphidinium_carterae.1